MDSNYHKYKKYKFKYLSEKKKLMKGGTIFWCPTPIILPDFHPEDDPNTVRIGFQINLNREEYATNINCHRMIICDAEGVHVFTCGMEEARYATGFRYFSKNSFVPPTQEWKYAWGRSDLSPEDRYCVINDDKKIITVKYSPTYLSERNNVEYFGMDPHLYEEHTRFIKIALDGFNDLLIKVENREDNTYACYIGYITEQHHENIIKRRNKLTEYLELWTPALVSPTIYISETNMQRLRDDARRHPNRGPDFAGVLGNEIETEHIRKIRRLVSQVQQWMERLPA
jgi:hypothetical protein